MKEIKNVHQKKLGYYFLKKLYAKNKKNWIWAGAALVASAAAPAGAPRLPPRPAAARAAGPAAPCRAPSKP